MGVWTDDEVSDFADRAMDALDCVDTEGEYFTVVFKGDIRKVKGLFDDCPKYGTPVASGYGHAFRVMEGCREVLEQPSPTPSKQDERK